MEQISLHDVHIVQVARIVEGRINGGAQVNPYDLARMLRGEKHMTPLAASGIQQNLALKLVRRVRCEVPSEISLALWTKIGKMPPLVAEAAHCPDLRGMLGSRPSGELILRRGEKLRIFFRKSGTERAQ